MKMKRSLLWAATAIVACVVAVSSCKPEPITVTGVTLDQSTLTLVEGNSVTLKATVKPNDAENKAVTWKSSKTDVATVDPSGKVTAVKEGSASITVTTVDGGKTATCAVTVNAKVTPPPTPEISVTTQPAAPESLTEGSIPSGTRLAVVASVTEGAALKYQWYIYDKANSKVSAAIDGATGANFTLSVSLKAGEYWFVCEISATGAETKFTNPVKVTVSVKPVVPPPALMIDPAMNFAIPAMTVGKQITNVDVSKAVSGGTPPYTYSATALPVGLIITPAGIISGTPTAAVAAGTAAITVKDSSLPLQSKTITIRYGAVTSGSTTPPPTPFKAVTDITDVPNAALAGIDLELTATVVPAAATNKRIEWSIKADAGTNATIKGNILRATSGGTVVVTATIKKGRTLTIPFTKDFTITVTVPANNVNFGGENEEEWP